MNVKKIEAPTMKDALEKVKIILGDDAIILTQKEIQKGGIFGFFSRKVVEVVAATDTNQTEPKPQTKTPIDVTKEVVVSEPALPDYGASVSSTNTKPVNIYNPLTNDLNKPVPIQTREPISNTDKELLAIEQEKSKKLEKELDLLKLQQNQSTSSEYAQYFPTPLKELQSYLREQDVNEKYCENIISNLLGKCYLQPNDLDYEMITKWAHEKLSQDLSLFKFGGISFDKKYVNVVGPTGVGKTTTIAKIAAHSKLEHMKKVALITADTYRISAVEQLQTYARLLELPMETVYSVEDFKKAKEKFADYDLVLIDTAGRNYRDSKYINDLKNVIDFTEEVESYLVLSLTSKLSDMREIYEQFSTIPIKQFIFTKMDETGNYGAMINLLMETKKGVSYLTNGQEVPDDIIEASPRIIADTLFKGGR